MALYQAINGIIQFQLASAYAPGSGTMVLKSGQGAAFGAISPANPVRITLIKQSTYGTGPGEITAIYGVTGRTVDTLTGVSAIEGTTDVAWAVGDYVECRETAGYVNDLEAVLAGKGTVSSVGLTAPAIMNVAGSPVTTTGTLGLSLATQAANTFFAGPPSGGLATPVFRTIASADLPAGVVPNAALANSNVTITPGAGLAGGGAIALGGSATLGVATGTANTLAGYNSGGAFSGVSVGSGLTLSGGTLAAVTGGGGTVTTVSVVTANGLAGTVANASTAPAITLSCPVTGLLKSNGTTIAAAVAGTDYLSSNQTITVSGVVTGSGTTAISTTYPSQAANLFLIGPTTGAATAPTFRAPVAADFPAGVIANAALANSSITVTAGTGLAGGGSVALGGTVTIGHATGTNNSLAGYNNTGVFSGVTVGSGLSLSAGTLTATSSGGSVTTMSIVSANGFAGTVANATTTPAVTLQTSVTGILKGNGTGIFAATPGTDYLTSNQAITLSGAVTGSGTTAITASFPVEAANLFLAGPATGSSATPAFRQIAAADFPAGVVLNSALANNSLTVSLGPGLSGGGSVALGGTLAVNMATGTANTLAGYNASGNFADVAIGTGLSLSGGTLTATGTGSGSVTNVTVASANGFSGTVANPTTTPAISINGPLTTKGDLFAYSTTNTRLPVGSDGAVVIADSTQATGLRWGTVPNASLANSAVTILAGFGILNAGAVSLGGSLSLSTWGQGVISVATHAARNAIPSAQVVEGMIVYTANTTGTDGVAGWWSRNKTAYTGTDTDWTAAGPLQTELGGTAVGARGTLNLIQGSNVNLTVVDNPGSDRVDVTIASTSGLAPIASHNVVANTTGSSATPTGVTLSALLDAAVTSTQGQTLVRGASAWGNVTASGSPQIIWASAIPGVIADANLSNGTFTTNNSAAINAVLAAATAANPVHLMLDGPIAANLDVSKGNITIQGLGAGTGLVDASSFTKDIIVANVGSSSGGYGQTGSTTILTSNVKIKDLRIYGGRLDSSGTRHGFMMLNMQNVANLEVSGCYFDHVDAYCVELTACVNTFVHHCYFYGKATYTLGAGSGQAGIQSQAGCSDIHVDSCYFSTNDDGIAFNPGEPPLGTSQPGLAGSNYTVTNCVFDQCLNAIRYYGGAVATDGLAVSNCVASCIYHFMILNVETGAGAGAHRNVLVDNCRATIAGSGAVGYFSVCGNVPNLQVSNFTMASPQAGVPLLTAGTSTLTNTHIASASFNGLKIHYDSVGSAADYLYDGSFPLDELTISGFEQVADTGVSPSSPAALIKLAGSYGCNRIRLRDFAARFAGDIIQINNAHSAGVSASIIITGMDAVGLTNRAVDMAAGQVPQTVIIEGLWANASHEPLGIAGGLTLTNYGYKGLYTVYSTPYSGGGTVVNAISSTSGSYQETLTAGLRFYWRCDDTGISGNTVIADSSGNSRNGTNSAVNVQASGPISGHGAIQFNGSNDISLVDSGLLVGTAWTVGGWFYVVTPTTIQTILQKFNGGSPGYFQAYTQSSGNVVYTDNVAQVQTSLPGSTWAFLAVTFSGSTCTAYLGTQTAGSLSTVGTFAHTQPVSGNESAPFTIGLTSGSPIVSGGRCSGVGAWTRALSSTEISQWWNGGNGLNVI